MPVSSSDLAILSGLLDEALDLEVDERMAWIDVLPEPVRHLGPLLREMLAENERARTSGFLSSIPLLDGGSDPSGATAARGELVGAYRLVREIGRGGMGEVWLADRADGVFQRQVALKLPRVAWGAGLVQRMAREREIGALLEHPNIARLYDAGVDERGRPYLALEYIDGQPVDAWCEAQGLDTRRRLRLFAQVAKAVAYAHGRLVVHRDLKPSNVLVTPDGQAHLLDFGIAKLLDEAPSDDTLGLTQQQGRVMTPHYASPEQVAGEAITVQSDVYSLGVLLYELVTGTLPIMPKRGTLGAVEEAVLQGDAPLASGRVKDRATAKALRGEIDAILAKAMQREPGRRYATVDAMAQDIERHLNGETVSARPDSVAYRLRKAARRHWAGAAAVSAIALALISGGSVAMVQARRGNAEAERARLVKEFVVDIFDTQGGADGALSQVPAQALLDRSASMIEGKFVGQPLLQAELYGAVGRMYFNMSNFERAIEFGRRRIEALDLAQAPAAMVSEATLELGDGFKSLDRWADAESRYRRALALADGNAELQVRTHTALAYVLGYGRDDYEAGKRELDAADALMNRSDVSIKTRAEALTIRAISLEHRSPPEIWKPMFDEAIRLGLAADGPLSRRAMNARTSLAMRLVRAHRQDEARPYLDAALAVMRATGGLNDVHAADEMATFAINSFNTGVMPFAEASATIEHSIATMRSQRWPVPVSLISKNELVLGEVHLQWGDVRTAYELTSAAGPRRLLSTQDTDDWVQSDTAAAAALAGHAGEAEGLARSNLIRARATANGPALESQYELLAAVLMQDRHYDDAEQVFAEFDGLPGVAQARVERSGAARMPSITRILVRLERGDSESVLAWTRTLEQDPGQARSSFEWLARATALCASGEAVGGLMAFDRALTRLAEQQYEFSPHLAYWRARMGLCALQAGQRQRARVASALASTAIARQPAVSAHFKAPVLELARRLGTGDAR